MVDADKSPTGFVLFGCELRLSRLIVLPAAKVISTPKSYPDFPWMRRAALLLFHELPSEEISPVLKQGNGRKKRYNTIN